MEEDNGSTKTAGAGWLTKALETIWEKVVIGDTKMAPEKSCYRLAAEYIDSGKTPEECARNFINWQTGKAGIAGFALGLPGLAAMPITIPADLASVSYLQLRMIAVIGILFGWDAKSDQFRTVAFSCLLGTVAGEAVRDAGVKAGIRFGRGFVRNIPGKFLKRLNKLVRVNNLVIKGVSAGTKAGGEVAVAAGARVSSRGIVNLSKMVPLLGGIVGGGLNIAFTRQMGILALRLLKDGPPDGGKSHANGAAETAGQNVGNGPAIDEVANIVEDFVSSLPEEYIIHEVEPGDQDASVGKATK